MSVVTINVDIAYTWRFRLAMVMLACRVRLPAWFAGWVLSGGIWLRFPGGPWQLIRVERTDCDGCLNCTDCTDDPTAN